jgi:hypothetical protein
MVERAAAGEAPSSPQPTEAGPPQGQGLRSPRPVRLSEIEALGGIGGRPPDLTMPVPPAAVESVTYG